MESINNNYFVITILLSGIKAHVLDFTFINKPSNQYYYAYAWTINFVVADNHYCNQKNSIIVVLNKAS